MKNSDLSENLISKIVYSDQINWMEIIKKEFNKKFIVDNDFAEEDISRAKKFLLQRGFEFDQINQLFK